MFSLFERLEISFLISMASLFKSAQICESAGDVLAGSTSLKCRDIHLMFLSLWTTFKIASQILHILSVCATTKELHSTISWSLYLNESICFLSLNEFKNLNDVMQCSFSLSRPSKSEARSTMISLSGPLKPQRTALSKLLVYLYEFKILDPLQKCFRSVLAFKKRDSSIYGLCSNEFKALYVSSLCLGLQKHALRSDVLSDWTTSKGQLLVACPIPPSAFKISNREVPCAICSNIINR